MKKNIIEQCSIFKTNNRRIVIGILLNACLFFGVVHVGFAIGNQNITINSTATSTTGTWTVTGSSVPYNYTFQPNAGTDVSNLNVADIVACLTGSNTTLGGGGTPPNTNAKVGNVTILTASTGSGVGTGNVTISQAISQLLSNASQLTLTITAAGSINVSNTISLKGNTGGTPGYSGANVILNSGTGVSMSGGSGIQTDGGAAAGGAGGNAGAVTMTATTGNVNLGIGSTAKGGAGNGSGAGGSGGNLTLTATVGTVTLGNVFNSVGGAAGATGAGGNGGALTMTGFAGATINAGWTSNGASGGATSGAGGTGGALTMVALGGTAFVNNTVTNYGANAVSGAGGAGGNVSLTAFTATIGVACNSYGGNGGGSGTGGSGGSLTMSAPAGTIILSNTYNSNGGTGGSTGAGGNGGAWDLSALSTVTVSVACSSNGGNGGATSGNGGNAGAMTFTSSASNVSMTNGLNAKGGNASAGNSSGGNGGTIIVYSATNFSSPNGNGNDMSTQGGNATGSGSSGNGANITLTGNAANGGLTLGRTYTTSAGNGGSGTAGTAGTLSVSTGNSVVSSGGTNDGQSGSGYPTITTSATPFTKIGTGIFLLGSTNNNYTGLTTVSSGTLKIGANNALGTTANGTTVSNGATIDINNINYTTTEALVLTGTGISSLGAMTTTSGTAGKWAGVVTISGGTFIGAATGTTLTISGQVTGSGGFTKADYGILSLTSTSNNYSGSTTISAGTLQIGATGVLPDASGIILNGGTLSTSGPFSESMGTLTLNAGSFLTFGSASAHTLTFANSNGISWAAGGNITITGWQGTYGAGTAGVTKFIVGSTGNLLTAAQLSKIQFVDVTTGAYWSAQSLSNGEIVPSTSATGNTFYAIANGNWNTNSTWSYTPGGAAVPAGVFPTSTKNVVISSSFTVTLTSGAACKNITFGSGASGLTMALNNLTISGNMNIVTTCPTISTTGGNIIFDGTSNSSQTVTSTCTGATLGNVTLINGANITSSGGAFSVTNLTSSSGTSSWINNASTGSTGVLTVTGALAAPACNFISNTAPTTAAFNFSGAINNPITVGGLISNSTGTINLGSKNTTISNLLSFASGAITSSGVISMAANSVIIANAALTIANLKLAGGGVSSSGGGLLTVTIFDFNGQTSFTQTAGIISTPTINTDTGPMYISYNGTPTFIYSGSGIIPSGSYYNLTTTTNTKSVTCSSTITVDGVLTNSSGTIIGPATSGQFGRFINANPVNNIGGTIGSGSTYISFSGSIQGGTVIGAGTNVLQNSAQSASCASTWTGATNTDWNTAGNWTPAVIPTSINDVTIPNVTNKPIIASGTTANAKGILINPSSSLTISSTAILNASGNIINNGTLTTVAGSTLAFTGSTAQTITGVPILYNVTMNNTSGGVSVNSVLTVNGTITLTSGVLVTNSNVTINFDNGGNIGYSGSDAGTISGVVSGRRDVNYKTHYMASPFGGVTSAQIAATTPLYAGTYWKMYSKNFTAQNWTAVINTTTAMPIGEGYSLSFVAPAPLILTGTYNHSLTFATTTYSNIAVDKYFMVGNPYPATIDWESAGITTSNIKNAIYYWDGINNRSASYIAGVGTNGATRYIPAMQSVLIATDGLGGNSSVSINNNARYNLTNPTYLRVSSDETIRIKIISESVDENDETVIRFNELATDGFDNELDATKIMNSGTMPSVYTSSGNQIYSINSFATAHSTKVIPVAVKLPADGNYSLEINNSDPTVEYVLVDKKLGTENLIGGMNYVFSGLKADDGNRFELQLRTAATTDTHIANAATGLQINSSTKGFVIKTDQFGGAQADIELLDMTGNVVEKITRNTLTTGSTFVPVDLSAGAYLVKVIIDGNVYAGMIVLTK